MGGEQGAKKGEKRGRGEAGKGARLAGWLDWLPGPGPGPVQPRQACRQASTHHLPSLLRVRYTSEQETERTEVEFGKKETKKAWEHRWM